MRSWGRTIIISAKMMTMKTTMAMATIAAGVVCQNCLFYTCLLAVRLCSKRTQTHRFLLELQMTTTMTMAEATIIVFICNDWYVNRFLFCVGLYFFGGTKSIEMKVMVWLARMYSVLFSHFIVRFLICCLVALRFCCVPVHVVFFISLYSKPLLQ